jgi:hypothetical protein
MAWPNVRYRDQTSEVADRARHTSSTGRAANHLWNSPASTSRYSNRSSSTEKSTPSEISSAEAGLTMSVISSRSRQWRVVSATAMSRAPSAQMKSRAKPP